MTMTTATTMTKHCTDLSRSRLHLGLCAAFAFTASLAEARITRIDFDPARSQSPTFGGLSFGAAGQYEKLRGTAKGELDPNDARNKVITDIELAPRNAANTLSATGGGTAV